VPLGLLRRSRSFKVTDFGTNRKLIYDFPLVSNSNLPPILHRFWDSRRYVQNRYIRLPLFCWTPPMEGFPWDDLPKILPGCQQMTKVPYGVETLPKISIAWVGCTNVTDRRQTDRRRHIANVNVSSRSLKKGHTLIKQYKNWCIYCYCFEMFSLEFNHTDMPYM